MNASNFSRKQDRRYDFLPPEPAPARHSQSRAMQRRAEVVDAEFEVIRTPLRAHYRVLNDNQWRNRTAAKKTHWAGTAVRTFINITENALLRMGTRSFAGIVMASVLIVFTSTLLLSGGQPSDNAAIAPGGVAISNVATSVIDSNGLRILEVNGQVENVTGHDLPAPRMAAEFDDAGDSPSITVFKLDEPVIAAGKSAAFSLKLPHPGGKVPNVRVSADAGTF